MTYAEAMEFWLARINYEHKSPRFGDFKLERMQRLLHLLDEPQQRYRIIHVAGSKGKGSTSALLASILAQEGYRTGLFTSPHLVRVEERFRVDGVPISSGELTALLREIRAVAGAAGLEPELTFFEIATAVGLVHFARRRVELAVLEVGLGGRYDSTNVCRPLVALITSISLDHTQILGTTLDSIAREKAGIIKEGRPTISGVRGAEARRVIQEVCRARHAPLVEIDSDFSFRYEPALVGPMSEQPGSVQVTTQRGVWPKLELGLVGAHQAANAALAILTIEELRRQGLRIGSAAVAAGLAEVRWPARLEIVGRQPLIVLDCAHNVASAAALAEALRVSFPLAAGGRRLLIFAGSRDKDLAGMLAELAPLFVAGETACPCGPQIYLTRFHTNPRCAPPEELMGFLPAPARDRATTCGSAAEALARARQDAGPDDLICVTGSVFLAGEARGLLCPDGRDVDCRRCEGGTR